METSSQAHSKNPRGRHLLSVLASLVLGAFLMLSGSGKLLNVNALIISAPLSGLIYPP